MLFLADGGERAEHHGKDRDEDDDLTPFGERAGNASITARENNAMAAILGEAAKKR